MRFEPMQFAPQVSRQFGYIVAAYKDQQVTDAEFHEWVESVCADYLYAVMGVRPVEQHSVLPLRYIAERL